MQKSRKRIHKRIRATVKGTKERPRLSVFRSHKHVYAQIIDDLKQETVCGLSDRSLKKGKHTKSDLAKMVGVEIAKKAKILGIKMVVFDRGGFRYHGRIRQVAEGAREEGLKF